MLKAIMDKLGLDATVGNPTIHHRKQGNVIGEMLSEHYTNLIQPLMMDLVDDAADWGMIKHYGDGLVGAGVVGQMVNEISVRIRAFGKLDNVAHGAYSGVLHDYFKKVNGWARLFI